MENTSKATDIRSFIEKAKERNIPATLLKADNYYDPNRKLLEEKACYAFLQIFPFASQFGRKTIVDKHTTSWNDDRRLAVLADFANFNCAITYINKVDETCSGYEEVTIVPIFENIYSEEQVEDLVAFVRITKDARGLRWTAFSRVNLKEANIDRMREVLSNEVNCLEVA